MLLCSGILHQELAENTAVFTAGRRIDTLSLRPPVFFTEGMRYEDGGVYIGAGILPEPGPSVSCLLICVGSHIPASWHAGRCAAFSLPKTDILTAFNLVQETFLKYTDWNDRLLTILNTTADLQEMVDLTAELLGRDLAVVDSRLQFLYGSTPGSKAGADYDTNLSVQSVQSWAALHKSNTSHREPFCYQYNGSTDYCINIYRNGIYRGILTMSPTSPEDEGSAQILFRHFADLFIRAMDKARNHETLPAGMRSIFRDVLHCLPVNQALLEREKASFPVRKWRCLVLRPHGEMSELPLEYFCRQLEEYFAASCALTFDSQVVLFLPVRENQKMKELPRLSEELRDFDVRCGVSQFFEQPENARTCYTQARIALQLASRLKPGEKIAYFRDYALSYALQNSVGDLRPRDLWPEGLRKIRSGLPREDSWKTLRTYLDLEMNATQTARVLYVHRTTLQAHLKKIEELVDLSTPESRMYIRYCMYLDELLHQL